MTPRKIAAEASELVGLLYRGSFIFKVEEVDETDDRQPALFRLTSGDTVWIPREKWPAIKEGTPQQ